MFLVGGMVMLIGSIVLGNVVSKKNKILGALEIVLTTGGGILFGFYMR